MSAYSKYDIDGEPLIPNTDNYISPDLKYGFSCTNEAAAELANLAFNDSSVNTDLVSQDINILLYEKQHVNCLEAAQKTHVHIFTDKITQYATIKA